MSKKTTKKITSSWSDADYQAFADRNILRASRIPNKRRIANRNACRDKAAWA